MEPSFRSQQFVLKTDCNIYQTNISAFMDVILLYFHILHAI